MLISVHIPQNGADLYAVDDNGDTALGTVGSVGDPILRDKIRDILNQLQRGEY